MPSSAGPNLSGESSLILSYDTGDTINSFKGQPTTNIGNNFRDFTGTSYSPDGEWSSDPTRFTKTYYPNLTTPIGPGATLIEESGTAGYHHLSRYGGGDESGTHCLSCYIHPLASNITDFCIGMLGDGSNNIQFNLNTRAITYGGGISNRNAFIRDVPGYPGWFRVGANFEGRVGGWVGCVGYSSYTSYTGTAGGKKAYITGIQYEYTTQPTSFIEGTRSVTQGLLPLVGTSSIDLSNVSFTSSSSITFDGINDYINLSTNAYNLGIRRTATFSGWVQPNNFSTFSNVVSDWNNNLGMTLRIDSGGTTATVYVYPNNHRIVASYSFTAGIWYYLVGVMDGNNLYLYVNGVLVGSTTLGEDIGSSASTLKVGNRGDLGGGYSNQQVALVQIYNRALTAIEILNNFNTQKVRFNY
jgi:hypothetical protein